MKTAMKKMNTLEVIEKIVDITNDSKVVSTTGEAQKYIKELSARLGIEPMQALFLAVFIDQCEDSRIRVSDLARHFDCRNISILSKYEVIESLVGMQVITRRKDRDGDISYRVPRKSLEAIRTGKLPEKECIENLSANEFINVVDNLVRQRGNDEISDSDLENKLNELLDKNQQLFMARKLKSYQFDYSDLLLFFVMSMCYINSHDDELRSCDIDDHFHRGQLREHTNALENGTHVLMHEKLVEHACINGHIDSSVWCLTNYAKFELYAELNLKQPMNVRSNLTHYEDIQMKPLFYTPEVTKQVNQLTSLLEKEKMQRVLKKLVDKGMRKGFTCLFYGGPGTGKTETVMQLARETKRDIMLVDVPSIRSKWVGETEKNIKAVFERYHRAVANAKDGYMPILLFNEADAILNKRNEGGVTGVDKMENAMQNIILQEMENLEGIMIATTNLTGSLDAAFERRFLYKIEFEKPTPKERQHIWSAMLPDLTEKDALTLAERFDFSGGQIENITRKRIISDILDEREVIDLDTIIESCKNEQLKSKNSHKHIGF